MMIDPHVGHISQIHSVEEHRLVGGKGDGMRLLEIRNGKGLEMTVSLDRNADISRLLFKGLNMSYMSPCGYVHPAYYDKDGIGFLKSFTAGFLTTCGLNAVGSPCEDDGETLPLHGTIANIPTSWHSYEIKGNEIVVKTSTVDEVIFAHKLVLNREIRISLLRNEFTVKDTVVNEGDKEYPAMLLYHMNMGYPLLSENSLVYIPSDKVTPRNDRAAEGIKEYDRMLPPTAGFEEQCYYHSFKEKGLAAIYNPDAKIGLSINFDPKVLPCFCEWKMMGERDYVLGLEPGNCLPDGRDVMRKKGMLKILKPQESVTYEFKIKAFDKASTINNLMKGE